MSWRVDFHPDFFREYEALSVTVQDELLALVELLQLRGSQLGRPHADTLKGSTHANMKELRFKADNGVWRVAFAFDPRRKAVLLVAGDKSGVKEGRFYKTLIKRADERYEQHLRSLKK
jgi:hypothetical protein